MRLLLQVCLAACLVCFGPMPGQAQAADAALLQHIAALDRAVSARPGDPQLRVDLGLALLRAGIRDRARYHLTQAQAAPLSPSSRAQLDAILVRLGREQNREGWISFAIVPETNPTQQSDLDSVRIGGVRFRLNQNARAQRATGLHFALGGALMPQIRDGLRLRIGLGVSGRIYEERALNDITWRGEFGLQGQTLRGQEWRVTASHSDRSLGGTHFGTGTGLHLAWSQPLGQSTLLRVRADLEDWRFPTQRSLDGTRPTVSVSLRHGIRPDLVVTGSLAATRINARAANEAGLSQRVSIGAQKAFAGGLILGAEASWLRHRRDGPSAAFLVRRRDLRTGYSMNIMHRDIRLAGFAPVLELARTEQRSNIPIHTWQNNRASLTLSRSF